MSDDGGDDEPTCTGDCGLSTRGLYIAGICTIAVFVLLALCYEFKMIRSNKRGGLLTKLQVSGKEIDDV